MDAQWFNYTKRNGEQNVFYLDPLWNCIAMEYKFLAPLGAGSFGQVMKVRHFKTGKIAAVKLLKS